VERLVPEFVDRVLGSGFSPAEALSLLLEHRQSSKSVVANVQPWITTVTEERQNKLKHEGSWAHSS
jgi:hypothetical protein